MSKKEPLYIQISEIIRSDILSERTTGILPSEKVLKDKFNVSRSVVRQALSLLEGECLIQKIHGKGSLVLPLNRSTRLVQSLNGLGMQLENSGLKIQTAVIKFEEVEYPDAPAYWGNKKAIHIVRVRSINNEKIAYIETFVPTFYKQYLTVETLTDTSLHEKLKILGNVQLISSNRTVLATYCSERIQKALGMPLNLPLLLLKGETIDNKQQIVEFFFTYHRSDKVQFSLNTTL